MKITKTEYEFSLDELECKITRDIGKFDLIKIPDSPPPIKNDHHEGDSKLCPECRGSKNRPNRIYSIWDDQYMDCYDIFHGKLIPGFNCF
jgi:hypothetical protein